MSGELKAKCRCCGWAIIYESFSGGSADMCDACTQGTCWKGQQHDVRTAAMDLIRFYVHRGDSEESLRLGLMARAGWASYDAHVYGQHIYVNRIHGQPIDATFSLHELYEACRAELTTERQMSLFEAAS